MERCEGDKWPNVLEALNYTRLFQSMYVKDDKLSTQHTTPKSSQLHHSCQSNWMEKTIVLMTKPIWTWRPYGNCTITVTAIALICPSFMQQPATRGWMEMGIGSKLGNDLVDWFWRYGVMWDDRRKLCTMQEIWCQRCR